MKQMYFIERDYLSMTAVLLKDYDYRDYRLRNVETTLPFGVLFNFN